MPKNKTTGFPRVKILTVDHKDQRYDTVGDWYYEHTIQDGECLIIKVSKMSDWRYEFLVAAHELVEVVLCRHAGISQKVVDNFDMRFEDKRAESKTDNFDEPGDEPNAPYRFQHCIATGVERLLAGILGVSWKKYEAEINSL